MALGGMDVPDSIQRGFSFVSSAYKTHHQSVLNVILFVSFLCTCCAPRLFLVLYCSSYTMHISIGTWDGGGPAVGPGPLKGPYKNFSQNFSQVSLVNWIYPECFSFQFRLGLINF